MTITEYQSSATQTNHLHPLPEPDNYIYFFHIGKTIILPTYPETVSDTMPVSFTQTQVLGRAAPLQSYAGSGPRTIQFSFDLHRDMMWQINYNNSSTIVEEGGDDYVDQMAKWIQSAALPEYSTAEKMVNPPMVAVKIANEIYIKGVVTGSPGIVYQPPVLRDGRFAQLKIQFAVTEVVPYSASMAGKLGSFRNLDYTLGTNVVYTAGTTTVMTDVNGEKVLRNASDVQSEYYYQGGIGTDGTE